MSSYSGPKYDGITLNNPGGQNPVTVTNAGTITNTAANYAAVTGDTNTWTISNAGTIVGGTPSAFLLPGTNGSAGGVGISLAGVGYISNTGLIQGGTAQVGYPGSAQNGDGGTGGDAIVTGGALHLSNSGTIVGGQGGSSQYYTGGSLINGGNGGAGGVGVVMTAVNSTVVNSAVITGGSGGAGGGSESGPAGNGGAGGAGVAIGNGNTLVNSGTITGGAGGAGGVESGSTGAAGAAGVGVSAGPGASNVINGASGQNSALIVGSVGVYGNINVTNFGTIASLYGAVGTAIALASGAGDTLKIEAGSTLIGTASGGGGSLVLDNQAGPGTLSGLGTTFYDFDQYNVLGTWTLTGTNAVGTAGHLSVLVGSTLVVAGSLVNSGAVNGALTLANGAYLGNAAGHTIYKDGVALTGISGPSTIVNAGYISATGGGPAIGLNAGGIVTNATTAAVIQGGLLGVSFSATGTGTVINEGTISGGNAGVYFASGGQVSNGSPTDSAALVKGDIHGIVIQLGAGTVINYGTVLGPAGKAVALEGVGGGSLSNAAGGLLSGNAYGAFIANGAGIVTNQGTILGQISAGVVLSSGGIVSNLAGGYIAGKYKGIYADQSTLTVTNAGTIAATDPEGAGIRISRGNGGTITNALGAVISGGYGILDQVSQNITVINYGTLTGSAVLAGAGIDFGVAGNSRIVNGGTVAGGDAALIQGTIGIELNGGTNNVTVTNYGTIASLQAAAGRAVEFNAHNNLVLEGGSKIVGSVYGGGVGFHSKLTLDAAHGAGTLGGGLGAQYTGFSDYSVVAGANWTLASAYNSIGAGASLSVIGTLTNGGTLHIDGSGTATIAGTLVNSGIMSARTNYPFVLSGGALANYGTANIYTLNVGKGIVGIAGPVRVLNAGDLELGNSYGIFLSAGGVVTNTGTISNPTKYVLGVVNGQGTLTNSGYINGSVRFNNGGTIVNTNAGYINGGSNNIGLFGTNTVFNVGTIKAGGGGTDYGSIVNTGTWISTNGLGFGHAGPGAGGPGVGGNGVLVNGTAGAAGRLALIQETNAAGASYRPGVGASYLNSFTLVNYGTIAAYQGPGAYHNAVSVMSTTLTVVVEGGSKFVGSVSGGGATYPSMLMLGGANGPGTITGLGTQYTGFTQYSVLAGATWTLSGNTTLLNHTTLTNAGTLFVGGNLVIDPSTLINSGYMSGSVTLTDGSYLLNTATGTLTAAGTTVYGYGGPVSITNSGLIEGPGSVGITLASGGFVTNAAAGTISARYDAVKISGTLGTVINSGTIAMTGVGSQAEAGVALFAGGAVTNTAGGLITGPGYAGVFADVDVATVVNYGSINGHGGAVLRAGGTVVNKTGGVIQGLLDNGSGVGVVGAAGTVLNYGNIAGLGTTAAGVNLQRGGYVHNAAGTAVISGYAFGVQLYGGLGAIVNAGTVAATGTAGIGISVGNIVSIANSGLVTAPGTAVYVSSHATVVNSGRISASGANGTGVFVTSGGMVDNATAASVIAGSGYGVRMFGGGGTIVNSGTVSAATGIATVLASGGTVTNNGGVISGGDKAVVVTSAAGTVFNTGLVKNAANYSAAIYLLSGGLIANQGGGVIQGGLYIKYATGTVTNLGTIASTLNASNIAVAFGAGGEVDNGNANTTTPLIDGMAAGIQIKGGSGTVNNFAKISAGTGVGVILDGGGTVSNIGSTSVIAGYHNGIKISYSPAQINNAGTIIAFGTGVGGGAGVYSDNGAVVTVANTGTIIGAGGVLLNQGGTVTNSSTGLIKGTAGSGPGVGIFHAAGTIINDGSIVDTGTSGYAASLDTGGLIVNRGQITGLSDVIFVAGGAATIANYGTIRDTGTSGDGICLQDGGTVTNFGTGLIVGSDRGVEIKGAPGLLVNYGSISGGFGVYSNQVARIVNAATTASITGYGEGVRFEVAAGTVINFGSITATATSNSPDGILLLQGGEVTNQAAGYISATAFGVYISGAAGTVTNLGTIANTVLLGNGGTLLNSRTIASTNGEAVHLNSGGTVVNRAGALIQGGTDGTGVNASGATAVVLNYGTVTGGGYSAVGLSTPGATLVNSGLISNSIGAGHNGVFTGGAYISNAARGTIVGYTGVSNTGTGAKIVNSGTISATGGAGVRLYAGATVTNAAGAIITGYNGIANEVTAATVINLGSIIGTGAAAAGVSLYGGLLVNSANALISAIGSNGVVVSEAGTVINGGTIDSAAGTGVRLLSAGSVNNAGIISGVVGVYLNGGAADTDRLSNTGTITGTYDGVLMRAGNQTAVNSGRISATATNGAGIYGIGGNVVNAAAGYIRSLDRGIDIGQSAGSVVNFGTIIGYRLVPGVGATGVGVVMYGGVLANSGGLISGASEGVVFSVAGTVFNGGSIGGEYALRMMGGGSVDNTSYIGGAGAAMGVYVDGGAASAAITNSGTIIGGDWGLNLHATTQTVVNSGVISAANGNGFGVLLFGGVVTNASTGFIGGGGGGVVDQQRAATIVNFGTIDPAGGSPAISLQVAGSTITNAGKIDAGSAAGVAIQFTGLNNRLILDPGEVIIGSVGNGGSVGITLELGSGGSTGTFDGSLGTNFIGVDQLVIDSNAYWKLNGLNTLFGTATISGGAILYEAGNFLTISGSVVNHGTLKAGAGGAITVGSGSVSNLGGTLESAVTLGANATLVGYGALSGPITNQGVVEALGGTLAIGGTVTGGGSELVGSSGVLELTSGSVVPGHITFVGSGGTIQIDGTVMPTNTIGSPGIGDVIDLRSVAFNNNIGVTVNNGTLTVSSGSARYNLQVSGVDPTQRFRPVNDQHGGTQIMPGPANVFYGYYPHGILLQNPASQNQATITNTATVVNTSAGYHNGAGVFGVGGGGGSYVWTLTNSGYVNATQANAAGVYFTSGGLVTNGSAGVTSPLIKGAGDGIQIQTGVGTVVNYGTIVGGGTAGPVAGVVLSGGGTIINSGGLISGASHGAYLFGTSTVVNSGTISAAAAQAVFFENAGLLINSAGGVIQNAGTGLQAVFGSGGVITVDNQGTIQALNAAAIYLGQGGLVVNGTSGGTGGVISASGNGVAAPLHVGTIFNYGNIIAGVDGAFLTGGYVRNGGTANRLATISGNEGLVFTSTSTVVNYGTIRGATKGIDGALNNGRLTVNNFGTIQGTSTASGTGIYMSVGGIVTNQSTGVIAGYSAGVAATNSAMTLVNSGGISAGGSQAAVAGAGVWLQSGGTVINTGSIAGSADGVLVSGAGAAVVNSGTIFGGGSAIAIYGGAPQVTNAVGGVIDGQLAGIEFSSRGTIDNAGTIIGETIGIHLLRGGYVLNRAGGRIVDAAGVGVLVFNASTTIVNSGFISGGGTSSGYGGFSFLGGTGVVSNQIAGVIEGYANGVTGLVGGTLTLSNAGAILATGTSSIGASTAFGGTVSNSGTIAGGGGGVLAGGVLAGATAGTVFNSGTIAQTGGGFGVGVKLGAGGYILNGPTAAASIIGALAAAIYATQGTIVNYGTIRGTGVGNAGAYLAAGGTVTNESGALITGLGAAVEVAGAFGSIINDGLLTASGSVVLAKSAVSVTNAGTIGAIGTGGFGASLQAGGEVDNFGQISGGIDGVLISGGLGIVRNAGTIASTAGTAGIGIALQAGGLVDNNGVGQIVGITAGVSLGGATAGTLTNAGTIRSTGTNGSAVNFGTAGGTLVNGSTNATSALIAGYHIGVAQFSPGAGPGIATIVNYGTIERTGQGSTGYAIQGGSNTTLVVLNSGTIEQPSATSGAAILLNSGTVVNRPGGVIDGAGGTGVAISTASGVNATITNFGTIRNETTTHSAVYFGHGTGLVDNGVNGVILSPRTAVSFGTGTTSGTVDNAGTIQSTGVTAGTAVYLGHGGTVVNRSTGVILTAYRSAVVIDGAAGTVTNFGTIEHTSTTGTSGDAVVFNAGGLLTNYNLITGAHTAIYGTPNTIGAVVNFSNVTGTVVNLGTILATTTDSHGVELLAGGTIVNGATNNTTALIEAGRRGIYTGGTFGVPTPGAVAFVFNYGTIENTNSTAADIQLSAGGTVTNHGLISGARTGINFSNTAGVVVNFATIISTAPTTFTAGSGVYLQVGGQIANQAGASITAARVGISIGNTTTTTGSVTIANAGTISGTTGIAVGAYDTGAADIVNTGIISASTGTGVKFGSGASTLTNAGTIIGGGTAVSFVSGGRLIVDPGAVFSGAIAGGTSGTLELASAGVAGALANVGGTITGFSQVIVDSGAAWSLTGATNLGAGSTLSDFGSLAIAGNLVNGGTIEIEGTAGLTLSSGGSGAGAILFVGSGGRLELEGGSMPSFPISGFGGGDTIDFAGLGFTGDAPVLVGTALYVTGAGGAVDTVTLTGILGHTALSTVDDGSGGTLLKGTTVSSLITGTYSNGLSLGNSAATNPGTVTRTGLVTNSGAGYRIALYAQTGPAWSITNYGSIVGDVNGDVTGLVLAPGGTVVNGGPSSTTALIAGGHTGVQMSPPGTIFNFGTIFGGGSGGGVGVHLGHGGLIVNGSPADQDAVIASSRLAIYVGGNVGNHYPGATGTVVNYATIVGGQAAVVSLIEGGTVSNDGLISGTNAGVHGVDMIAAGLVDNAGTIVSDGVAVYLFGGTVANTGKIVTTGAGNAGVVVANTGLVANNGGLISGAGYGVGITGGLATITNTGTIVGNVGVQVAPALALAETIANYGTIIGSGGVAVAFGGGIDELIVGAGSVLLGAGGGAGILQGLQAGDTLDFRAIAGATGTIGANNLLTVSGGGTSATLQLDPTQDFTGDSFSAGADGSGGTLLTLSAANVVLPGHTVKVTGTVTGFTVLSGGTLEIEAGGTALDTVVLNGGLELIDSGGTDISGTISSGGTDDVFGLALNTLLIGGGSMTVETTGLTQGVVLDDSAVQTVSGVAIGTTVSATDSQVVAAGGVASATVVSSGGVEVVLAGGTTSDTVIAGGIVDLNAGAVASGDILFTPAGGSLIVRDTTGPGAVISGLSRLSLIDLHAVSPNGASAPVFDSNAQTVTLTSGGVSEVLHVAGVPANTVFSVIADGFGGTVVHEVPPTPGNFGLTAASDSGVAGDDTTNVATPTVSGIGEAGDIVTVAIAGGTTVSSTVGVTGTWSLQLPHLADGTYGLTAVETDPVGASSGAATLAVTIDTVAPVTTNNAIAVAASAGTGAFAVPAPSDAGSSPSTLKVLVTALPTDGTVTLGGNPVTLNQNLTVTQLASGLSFTPNANAVGTNSTFGYTVSDVAGNTTAGLTTISVVPDNAPSLFDFVFTYNDGRDYYLGTVADDGTFGYQVNQTKTVGLGQYSIYANAGLTTQASGTVSVLNYSHNAIGQGSPVPVKTAQGLPDGTGGLGSESDAVLGTDGAQHPFSPTQEASFSTTSLYGFVFTYADNKAFYSGTVADDGTFGTAVGTHMITNSSGNLLGIYTVFADGVTSRASGSVVVDQFTVADDAIPLNHASATSVDGSAGLGSEIGSFTVNGSSVSFSPFAEPSLAITIAPVTDAPPPDQGTIVANEVAELYHEVLNRDPDSGGLAVYTAAIENGMSLSFVRQALAASDEARLNLNQLYHQIFGRDIDPSGFATYTQLLSNGETFAAVQSLLAQSQEAQTDINQLYLDVLNRNGDPGGLLTYTGVLATGFTDLSGVRSILAHSQEAASDLNQLFANDIGRTPSAAELLGMENQLGAGNGATQTTVDQALKSTGNGGGFTVVTPPAGDASLTAQPGVPTVFAFDSIAFGHDTIAGFDPTRDTVALSTATVPDFSTVVSDAVTTGGNTVITFNGSQSITLTGVGLNHLTGANFVVKPPGGTGPF